MNANRMKWRFGLAAGCALLPGMLAAQQVTNPIPQPIVYGSIRVRIDDLVQMPATLSTVGKPDYSTGAHARINFLRESPDGRLFVNDLRGQLYTLDANYQPQLYLDLDAANGGSQSMFPATWYSNGLASGFISFNFHPEFTSNGIFYTLHMERASDTSAVPNFAAVDQRSGSHPVNWHTVLTEWTAANPLAPSWNEATGSRRELLRVGTTADAYFHPYGDLQFNPLATPGDPDYGMLYVSGGDWGYINGAGAPQGSPTEGQPGQLQRLDTLAGTLIRIDPRSPTETGGQAGFGDYTVPADNPFVDGNSNTFDEIYAFGFRNGHRMAWDREDGQLYVMSVGHANLEEIERIVAGGNYGWGWREGTFVNGNDISNGGNGNADHVFANNVPDALDLDLRGQEYLYPVVQYDHGEGNGIAGGFVYQGHDVPQLQGKYVFGDIVNGRVFVADMNAIRNVDITEPTTNVVVQELQLYTVDISGVETDIDDLRTLVGSSRADIRFGVDSQGEIFILTKTDGFIRKLAAAPLLGDFDEDGSIGLEDYEILVANLHSNVSHLTPGQSYLLGDMNRDVTIDFLDFAAFRDAVQNSGVGALEDLLAEKIPEPSTIMLLIVAIVGRLFLWSERRGCRRTVPLAHADDAYRANSASRFFVSGAISLNLLLFAGGATQWSQAALVVNFNLQTDQANGGPVPTSAATNITSAMNAAVGMFNNWSDYNKAIDVYYNSGVATADGNFNGTIRFGAGTQYHNANVAFHEVLHVLGAGTYGTWPNLVDNVGKFWLGAEGIATSSLYFPNEPLKADLHVFWVGGGVVTDMTREGVHIMGAIREDMGLSNGNLYFLPGDFSENGSLGWEDYQILTANLHTDVSSLTSAESYLFGDMNRDLKIDFQDFTAFRNVYPISGTRASLDNSAFGLPEPSTMLLVGFVVGCCMSLRWTIRR